MRAYAELIGVEMGLEDDELQKLRWAALLHDLGKTTVPVEILDLKGRPDAAQWAVLAAHPAAGEELSEPLREWLGPWWHGIGQHHEKWDGSGYPGHLAGEEIALAGRIVALADAYETMTAVRSYKQPMSTTAAREEVVRCAGAHFDPAVVRAFLAIGLGRLRRVMGVAAWVPLQLVTLVRIPVKIGASLTQLSSASTSAVAQLPAVVAITGSIGIAAVIPQIRESAMRVEPAAALAAPPATGTGAATDPGDDATKAAAPDAGPADLGMSQHANGRPEREPGSAPTTAAVGSGPIDTASVQAFDDVVSTDTIVDEPTTTVSAATPTSTTPTSTAPAPTSTAPSTTFAPTTTAPPAPTVPATFAPTTTPAPAPTQPGQTTVAAPPAPLFLNPPAFTWTGDGRHLEATSARLDTAGLAATCTLWVPDTSARATGPCDGPLAIDLPMWNTPYTVQFQATTSSGSSAIAGASMTSLPKALAIDASSHWPCPGWFCGSAARGFAGPSILTLSTARAAGTQVRLLCTVTGLVVDTRAPFSAGTEYSTKWVKSTDATKPYYSVLSFPTPGETAADGLPAC